MKPEQERVKNLLTDTLTLLCKNGLNYQKELKVQGLLGITTDEEDVFIVHINEKFGNELGSISVSLSSEWGDGNSPLAMGAAALGREKPQRKERSSDLAERRESGRHEKARTRKRPPDSPLSPSTSPSQKSNQPAPPESPLSKYPRESSSHDEDSQSTVQSSIQTATIKIKQEEDEDVIIMDKKPCREDRIPQDDGTYGIPGQSLSDQSAMQHSYGNVSLQDIQSGFPRFDPISNSTLSSNRTSKRTHNMAVQESTDQSHSTDFSSEVDLPAPFITGMVEHVGDQPGGTEGDNSGASWDNPALGPLTSDGQVLLENTPGCSTWDSSLRTHTTSQSGDTSESTYGDVRSQTSRPTLDCHLCHKIFNNTRSLYNHLKRDHGVIGGGLSLKQSSQFPAYRCSVPGCGRTFYHDTSLYRHYRRDHKFDSSRRLQKISLI